MYYRHPAAITTTSTDVEKQLHTPQLLLLPQSSSAERREYLSNPNSSDFPATTDGGATLRLSGIPGFTKLHRSTFLLLLPNILLLTHAHNIRAAAAAAVRDPKISILCLRR